MAMFMSYLGYHRGSFESPEVQGPVSLRKKLRSLEEKQLYFVSL